MRPHPPHPSPWNEPRREGISNSSLPPELNGRWTMTDLLNLELAKARQRVQRAELVLRHAKKCWMKTAGSESISRWSAGSGPRNGAWWRQSAFEEDRSCRIRQSSRGLNHAAREVLLVCARVFFCRFASARRLAMSPYDEGVRAARIGNGKDDNPYPRGTIAHSEWNNGYDSSVGLKEGVELDFDWAR